MDEVERASIVAGPLGAVSVTLRLMVMDSRMRPGCRLTVPKVLVTQSALLTVPNGLMLLPVGLKPGVGETQVCAPWAKVVEAVASSAQAASRFVIERESMSVLLNTCGMK